MWRTVAAFLLFAYLFLVGCSGSKQEGKPLTLQSGRVVRVLEVVPLHYPNGATAIPPTLLFEYQTDLTIPTKATDSWHDLYAEIAEILVAGTYRGRKGSLHQRCHKGPGKASWLVRQESKCLELCLSDRP
jgi:hypothetical protein